VEVRGRVTIRRLVATPDMPALDAAPQVHPARAHREAFDTSRGHGRRVVLEIVQVRADVRHALDGSGKGTIAPSGYLTLLGIGGGTLPVGFFTLPYEVSVASTYSLEAAPDA
jgi:hypothetical protein